MHYIIHQDISHAHTHLGMMERMLMLVIRKRVYIMLLHFRLMEQMNYTETLGAKTVTHSIHTHTQTHTHTHDYIKRYTNV